MSRLTPAEWNAAADDALRLMATDRPMVAAELHARLLAGIRESAEPIRPGAEWAGSAVAVGQLLRRCVESPPPGWFVQRVGTMTTATRVELNTWRIVELSQSAVIRDDLEGVRSKLSDLGYSMTQVSERLVERLAETAQQLATLIERCEQLEADNARLRTPPASPRPEPVAGVLALGGSDVVRSAIEIADEWLPKMIDARADLIVAQGLVSDLEWSDDVDPDRLAAAHGRVDAARDELARLREWLTTSD